MVNTDANYVRGAVGFPYDPDWDPDKHCPDASRSIRAYDQGQYFIVFNRPRARWQLLARWRGGLRMVKTWEGDAGEYRPLTIKLYDWLVESSLDFNFGTRDAAKVSNELDYRMHKRKEQEDLRIAAEVRDYAKYERRTLAKLHSRWQKQEAFDPAMLTLTGGAYYK